MEDERLSVINQQKQEALNQSNNIYNGLLTDNENLYNQQQDYASQYEQTQNETLDKQLAFQESQIEKQKDQARQNMEQEQKKAQNDYMSFINPYGVQAESQASSGLLSSGVAETSKLGGYNTYQNRLATANKAMQDAFTEYDSAINEARLNNDVQKAQNALTKLQMQLEYAQTYYSNKSTISQNQLTNNQSIDSDYYGRYMDTVNQINYEKEQEEARRQFEEQLAYQRERDKIADQQWQKEYALSKSSISSSSLSDGSSLSNSSSLSEGSKSANGYTVIANPYTNDVNPDAKYGVFQYTENGTKTGTGYQPNNVGGTPLSNSGMKVSDVFGPTAFGSSGENLGNQKIWKADNHYYVWDGSRNDYIDITNEVNQSQKQGMTMIWGR